MGNYGMDMNFWLNMLMGGIALIAGTAAAVFMLRLLLHMDQKPRWCTDRSDRRQRERLAIYRNKRNRLLTATLICGLLTGGSIGLFFLSFGPGEPVENTPAEQDGMNRLNQQAPDEPDDGQLEQDAENKKEPALKRQDEDAAKDKQEADDYVDELLKRRQKQNRNQTPEKE